MVRTSARCVLRPCHGRHRPDAIAVADAIVPGRHPHADQGTTRWPPLTVAWHLATQRDWPVTPRVRARRSRSSSPWPRSSRPARWWRPPRRGSSSLTSIERDILEPRGSVDPRADADPAAPRRTPADPQPSVTVPVPGVVSVAVSKKAPVPASGHASDRIRHETHGPQAARRRRMPATRGQGDGGTARRSLGRW